MKRRPAVVLRNHQPEEVAGTWDSGGTGLPDRWDSKKKIPRTVVALGIGGCGETQYGLPEILFRYFVSMTHGV